MRPDVDTSATADTPPVPSYGEIRKTYVVSRIETLLHTMRFTGVLGNWRQAAKNRAHQEFNAFVQAERAKAAQDARLIGLAEGWDHGWLHRGAHPDSNSDEYGRNPFSELLRQRREAEHPSS
jgi:hypothetical protein